MKKRVLFVDDSPSVVQAAYDELSEKGYEVDVGYDGEEALDRLKDNVPDIIILDIEMPRMRGDEVAERIRKSPNYANIPLIALTARSAETIGEKSGYFDAYLIKPFGFEQMLKIIIEKIGEP